MAKSETEAKQATSTGSKKSPASDATKNPDDSLLRKNIKEFLSGPYAGDSNEESAVNVADLLDKIISGALAKKSSDVHIEPEEARIVVRYRIDGMLREEMVLNKVLEAPLIFKIKINAKLPTDEHFAPLDGRITFVFDGKKLDTRVSILPTTKGEKVVFRLLTSEGKGFSLEELGIVGKDLEVVKKSYSKPYGMILAVGPTGSGKTTTLYSIVKLLNTREVNITTVEDPVEYDIPGVNHVQVNVKADLTFATGLRSLLRQDPDIMMIGEIRDGETARIAINSAMTGHLVLSTLHTNDAVTTIPRLIDLGVEHFLLASTLNVIVAQRLSRRLCDKCKKEYEINEAAHEDIKKTRPDIAALIKPGTKIFHEVGCAECSNTGYRGRVGLYEILEIKEKIRRIIAAKGTVDEVFQAAREEGLILIVEDGINKMMQGTVSLAELLRVTAIKE